MTVPFKELAGSPVETYGPDGMKAERRILCAWEDRLAMVGELLGTGYSFGGTQSAGYPDRQGVVAVQVKVEPFESRPDQQGAFSQIGGQLNSYSGQLARLTIDYELPAAAPDIAGLPALSAGTTLRYRVGTAVEYLPSSEQAVPTTRVPVIAHHLTVQPVAEPPWEAIRASIGSVNSEPLLGAPAGSLLFASVSSDRVFTGLDDQQPQHAWRIHYVFKEWVAGSTGGNYGWESGYPSPEQGGSPGGSLPLGADFAPLFQFGR